jgi:gamma-glutamyl:cysteine ligase YbdK (ATP-grasp superfamily)
MGEEIESAGFSKADFARFGQKLAEETALARRMFADGRFCQSGYMLGFEIEAWILDHNFFPASINQRLLETLANPLVVPELSRFNVELNCEPMPLAGDVLDRAVDELTRLWDACNAVAHGLDANMVMIGTLPTIRDEDLTPANISPLNRYYALNREVLRQRRGRALRVDISGREHLVSEHRDVMLEAATTSFQIHLKTPARLAHRYYNASIALSGPVIAACGNAPFLFGKDLWEETRIPLFEQAVDVPRPEGAPRRVSMGSDYLASSCLEVFEQNLRDYPSLLPMTHDDPPEALRHLRLHNGTIWRWNRLLIGFDAEGAPHLRIEHRILPAGPTIRDMIANTALFVGLAHWLASTSESGADGLSFADARHNFYAAARHGLEATLIWPGGGPIAADRLLTERLIPQARQGLADLGVAEAGYLDIVEARVHTRQTGAIWQRKAYENAGRDVYKLMAAYCERQRSGAPVHQWDP